MIDAKIAVVAHIYYEEIWPELVSYLHNIPQDFRLFVSIPEGHDEKRIRSAFADATVVQVKNVGRDIAPFLRLMPDLRPFDAVCKIHTKGRPRWRTELLSSVLGSRHLVRSIVAGFLDRPDLVLVGSKALFLDGPTFISGNGRIMTRLFGPLPRQFGFFAGTMFWLRPSAFAYFAGFATAGFVQHNALDGQLEHAIERLFGARAAALGAEIGVIDTRAERPELHVVSATWPGAVVLPMRPPEPSGSG
jgi:lipopolysaccharide biosynthesis protein